MKRCRFCAEAIQDAAVVCRFCGRDIAAESSFEGVKLLARVLRAGEVALGVAALGLVGYLLAAGTGAFPARGPFGIAAGATQEPPPPPLVLSLLESRTLDIDAGEHFDTTFVVDDPRPCTFTGEVTGLSGGDRDVDVFLFDQAGYDQWHDMTDPVALWERGRTDAAALRVALPGPGRYALLLSNRFSVFTDKTVRVEQARVTCE